MKGRRIWRSIAVGLSYGMAIFLVGLLHAVLRGLPGGWTELSRMFALCMLGGLGGGAALGVLRPLVRGRFSAALVGIPVAAIAFVLAAPLAWGLPPWDDSKLFALIVGSIGFGAYLGSYFWRQHRPVADAAAAPPEA
jgi:hypothetical protein